MVKGVKYCSKHVSRSGCVYRFHQLKYVKFYFSKVCLNVGGSGILTCGADGLVINWKVSHDTARVFVRVCVCMHFHAYVCVCVCV